MVVVWCFFFQAEDGIRDLVRSRGLGDVYKRQAIIGSAIHPAFAYYKLEVGPGDSPSDDQMALISPGEYSNHLITPRIRG